jgi:hypothetical protein
MYVTVEELKMHLRIEQAAEDVYLGKLLAMAQAAVEDFCGGTFETPAEPVRLAVLLHASHFYAHREGAERATYLSMVDAFKALLWPYRVAELLF